jgi:hypothetical protein
MRMWAPLWSRARLATPLALVALLLERLQRLHVFRQEALVHALRNGQRRLGTGAAAAQVAVQEGVAVGLGVQVLHVLLLRLPEAPTLLLRAQQRERSMAVSRVRAGWGWAGQGGWRASLIDLDLCRELAHDVEARGALVLGQPAHAHAGPPSAHRQLARL